MIFQEHFSLDAPLWAGVYVNDIVDTQLSFLFGTAKGGLTNVRSQLCWKSGFASPSQGVAGFAVSVGTFILHGPDHESSQWEQQRGTYFLFIACASKWTKEVFSRYTSSFLGSSQPLSEPNSPSSIQCTSSFSLSISTTYFHFWVQYGCRAGDSMDASCLQLGHSMDLKLSVSRISHCSQLLIHKRAFKFQHNL